MPNLSTDQTEIESLLPEVTEWVESGKYDFVNCATAKDRNGPYCKMDVLAAALQTNVNLGQMAALLNRTRSRLRVYINSHADLLAFVNDYAEAKIDNIEQNVLQAAEEGDLSMARFVLTTLGKSRGYTTRADSGPTDRDEDLIAESPKDKLQKMVSGTAKRAEAKPDLTVVEGGKSA